MPGHAIICGGGFSGLLAARALSEHFGRVTVLERDPDAEPGQVRQGVPQSAHVHTLLKRGELVLNELFPGIDADFRRAGAADTEWNADVHFYHGRLGVLPRFPGELTTPRFSRTFLEEVVRARVRQIANVAIRSGTAVESLEIAQDPLRVTGVRVAGEESPLLADLIVDASGRNGKLLPRLRARGIGQSPELLAKFPGGYATRIYRLPKRERPWKTVYINHSQIEMTGMIAPIENGLHMVALIGSAPTYPPADEAGFQKYVEGLPDPILEQELEGAEALTPISVFRKLDNTCKLLHLAGEWPRGLVVVGDSLFQVNPAFAQGMTVAGLTAQLLGRLAGEAGGLPGRERRFHEQALRQVESIWKDNTATPLLPHPWGRLAGRISCRIRAAILSRLSELHLDPNTRRICIQRDHMLVGSAALLRPYVLLRALQLKLARLLHRR